MKSELKADTTMICESCDVKCQRFGTHRNGLRRFRCPQCRRTFTEPHKLTLGEMYVSEEKTLLVLQLLLEGNSIRSTQRITGIDQNTIMKMLVLAGRSAIANGPLAREHSGEGRSGRRDLGIRGQEGSHKLPMEAHDNSIGDAYCFVAIERKMKLVLNFALGRRDQATTDIFIEGLRAATSPKQRFQITTDGFQPYVSAITTTLSDRCDFAQLIKVYASPREGEQRYSPADVVEALQTDHGRSRPREDLHVSVERQNLTIRMQMRR